MDIGLDPDSLENMSGESLRAVDFNISNLAVFQVSEDTEVTALADPVYEQFLADVWVGIVLTLMEWKHRVTDHRTSATVEAGTPESELPSYTIASGLPSYQEALEQLKKVKELTEKKVTGDRCSKTMVIQQETSDGRRQEQINAACDSSPNCGSNTLSVFNLFGIYNRSGENRFSKPS